MRYRIERDAEGFPRRLWWLGMEPLGICDCGSATDYTNHRNEVECDECRKRRLGFYLKGAHPSCRWCGGRGCLACPSEGIALPTQGSP